MGKSADAPDSPEYIGQAMNQSRSQMTSQYTPYGSQTYSADPSTPSGYRSDITLAPQAQGTLDSQMALSRGLADTANQRLPALQEHYSKPMQMSSVPAIADASYQAQTARLDPQWNQREAAERTRLSNMGLASGGEAYGNNMRDFNQGRNDAYSQARLGAIATMPQTYQLESAAYNQPLNTINALRSGGQIQNPQFGQTPTTQYLNAANAQGQYDINRYGIQQGGQNNMMGGLFGLGSAAISAWG